MTQRLECDPPPPYAKRFIIRQALLKTITEALKSHSWHGWVYYPASAKVAHRAKGFIIGGILLILITEASAGWLLGVISGGQAGDAFEAKPWHRLPLIGIVASP